MAQEFARGFPAVAAYLARPLRNPPIEALVEGLGVLAGRIERVLDATAPRAAVHFTDLLFPELLRPFPAATIIEVLPAGAAARERRWLEAGAEFEGISVDGVRPRFRAHAPLRTDPWRVEDARLAWSSDRGQSLDVLLGPIASPRDGAALSPVLPLRLFLAGEPRSALALLASLHEHVAAIELVEGDRTRELPRTALRSWGLDSGQALLPRERDEHPGFRLVRELLVLPAKFAFVEVVADVPPPAAPRVTLRFRFATPIPQSVQVTRDSLRTNCIPVANVFDTTTEPLRADLERPTHVLRAAGLAPAHAEVYGVRRVTAEVRTGGRMEIAEGAAFAAAARGSPAGLVYTLHRQVLGAERAPDLVLGLETAVDATSPDIDVLSLEVWATNRALPSALGVGDVRIATPLSPPSCTFRNIVAVSPYRPPPVGEDLRWRTLALLAMTARSLARTDSLRALLHALDLHRTHDRQAARAHAQRVEAIRSVTCRPAVVALERGIARGTDITLELAERAFEGDGDAILFGRVLAQLFAHEASLNAFARTTLRLAGSGRQYVFPALSDERTVG
jgi:type VI secretion system protein ImpG